MASWHSGAIVIAVLAASGCAMGPAEEFGPQATATPAALTHPMSQFREVLSPYGTWMELPDEGWVWRPDPNAVSYTHLTLPTKRIV